MNGLANTISETEVAKGSLAIFWLSQAGFAFKTNSGKVVYIDPYLSDAVERTAGFKRMMSCPIRAEEVVADLIVCTHEHPDHLDTDALPIVARNTRALFAGPAECVQLFRELGIANERCRLLETGTAVEIQGIRATGVYADHGDLAPDAIGVVLDLEGIRVYHTGDTAYRPEKLGPAIEMRPEVLLPCINGRYGNLTAQEAALLTRDVGPRLAIATHFWMFVEHNGDPGAFLEHCSHLAPGVRALVMKPGESYVFRRGPVQT